MKHYVTIFTLVLFTATIFPRKMTDWPGPVFPLDHALNMPIDSLPVHENSAQYITTIGAGTSLHPDFGTSWNDGETERQMGIPYNIVGANQPEVPITFFLYKNESDLGPWPIPDDPFIETVSDWREESDGDRHMIVVDTSTHTLYETGNFYGKDGTRSWQGGCGAVFNLDGYELRPETWTSADAAGLPIFPLLLRFDEVDRALNRDGVVHHAIRFTVQQSQKTYVWPARHYASSSTDKNFAPMGLRVRLNASYDITDFSPRVQVILRTMKKYGMIVADNGSNWYFQGTHDERWDNEELSSLKKIKGGSFEVVDISPWMSRDGFDKNSARVPSALMHTAHKSPPTVIKEPLRFSAHVPSPETIVLNITMPYSATVAVDMFDLSGRRFKDCVRYLQKGTHSFVVKTAIKSRHHTTLVRVTTSQSDTQTHLLFPAGS